MVDRFQPDRVARRALDRVDGGGVRPGHIGEVDEQRQRDAAGEHVHDTGRGHSVSRWAVESYLHPCNSAGWGDSLSPSVVLATHAESDLSGGTRGNLSLTS